jgi:hypothetical protein
VPPTQVYPEGQGQHPEALTNEPLLHDVGITHVDIPNVYPNEKEEKTFEF